MLDNLVKILHDGGYSCVIESGGKIRTFTQRGVADLYDIYCSERSLLSGASIADKVVGKAAAAIMVLGGVSRLHADVISEPAAALLQNAGVELEAVNIVPHIINRTKTGWCPLESASCNLDKAEDIFPVIDDFVRKMRSAG